MRTEEATETKRALKEICDSIRSDHGYLARVIYLLNKDFLLYRYNSIGSMQCCTKVSESLPDSH